MRNYTDSTIFTPDRLQREVDYFLQQDAFVFDVETWGPNRGVPTQNDVLWIGLATNARAISVPMGHPNGNVLLERATKKLDKLTRKYDVIPAKYDAPPSQMTPSEAFSIMKPLFFSDLTKIAHSATFDLISVTKYFGGEIPTPKYRDTIVMQWLLNENLRAKGLKELVKRYYKHDYDTEEVGKCVEAHPLWKVARYQILDVRYPWLMHKHFLKQIKEDGLERVLELEEDVLGALLRMGTTGAQIDENALADLEVTLAERLEDVEGRIYKAAGRKFNLNSPAQKAEVLFSAQKDGGQGLRAKALTDGGTKAKKAGKTLSWSHYSTASDVLDDLPADNDVVQGLVEYQELNKLQSTYVHGYLGDDDKRSSVIFNGKIYTDFVQYGTVTGRFSCVSGNTLLSTSRGVFRFDEYLPQMGDEVVTHKGNRGKVLRKIYKGQEQMFRVTLSNGSSIECTREHRVFTPCGWKPVGELSIGTTVYSYGSESEVRAQLGEREEGSGVISFRREANRGGDIEAVQYDLPECAVHSTQPYGRGGVPEGEGTSVFAFKDGLVEPYAGQEWFPTPQLPGGDQRWEWLQDGEDRQEVPSGAPVGNGAGFGSTENSLTSGGASHRRGQAQQRPGQLGCGDEVWSRETARVEVVVREVAPLGTMGVWDIEVEGDHSYLAHGFLNHNSRRPNMQNVPAPSSDLGKQIRGMFVAPQGHKLVVADYGQIELVMLAHFIQEGALYDGFHKGVDPHSSTAAALSGQDPIEFMTKITRNDPEAKNLRSVAKGINFATVYGAGPDKVASMAGINIRQAKDFMNIHQRQFPEVYKFKAKVIADCRRSRPSHITTIFGRRRRLPEINFADQGLKGRAERQAVNSLIQGSSADLIKYAMVRLDRLFQQEEGMSLSLTVHDELVCLAVDSQAERCAELVKEAMLGEGIQSLLTVPLSSDVKIVERWSDAK